MELRFEENMKQDERKMTERCIALGAEADDARVELVGIRDAAAKHGVIINASEWQIVGKKNKSIFKTTKGRPNGQTSASHQGPAKQAPRPPPVGELISAAATQRQPAKAQRILNPSIRARAEDRRSAGETVGDAGPGGGRKSVPPIVVNGGDSRYIASVLQAEGIQFKIDSTRTGTMLIKCVDSEGHSFVSRILTEAGTNFYTFTPRELKPTSFLLRGLTALHPIEEIVESVLAAGVPGLAEVKISNFPTRMSRENGTCSNLFSIQVSPGTDLKELSKLRMLMHHRVTLEPLKRQDVLQCHRCQRFGHISYNCRMPPRCVRCAENHASNECPLKDTDGEHEQIKCVLCGQNHTSSYRGCQKRLNFIEGRAKKAAVDKGRAVNNKKLGTIVNEADFPAFGASRGSSTSFAKIVERAKHDAASNRNRQQIPSASEGTSTGNDIAFFMKEATDFFGQNPFKILPKLKAFLPRYKAIKDQNTRMGEMLNFMMSLAPDV